MNIFQFLGLPEDHRNHPFMLVKHRGEVPEKKLTFPCYAQVKRDGIFSAVVVRTDGVVGILVALVRNWQTLKDSNKPLLPFRLAFILVSFSLWPLISTLRQSLGL